MKNYNGTYVFAKKTFKADFKKSKIYIAITALTMAIIFNLINISYNNIYTSLNQYYVKKVISEFDIYIYRYPISLMQKQNLLIVVIITMLFAAICNSNYIKRRGKEIAFMISNGASLVDVTKYLLYSTGRCYLIAVNIAIFLGVILIPVFNYAMNMLIGREGKVFNIDLDALWISVIYIFMQYLILVILNIGFVARKEVIELINIERKINMKDKRQVKIPAIFFLGLYLIPIIVAIFSKQFVGLEDLTIVTMPIGVFGIYGINRFFIPKIIEKSKRKKFMYSGTRRIYYCNFLYSLSNSIIYIIALVFSISYFTYNIVEFKLFDGMLEMNMFSIFICSLIISSALLYKLLVDTSEKVYLYWQLKIIGYSEEDIINIVKKESILFFFVAMILPILLIIVSVCNYVKSGVYNLNLAITILAIIIIPIILISIISIGSNKKNVKRLLYGENNSLKNIVK